MNACTHVRAHTHIHTRRIRSPVEVVDDLFVQLRISDSALMKGKYSGRSLNLELMDRTLAGASPKVSNSSGSNR